MHPFYPHGRPSHVGYNPYLRHLTHPLGTRGMAMARIGQGPDHDAAMAAGPAPAAGAPIIVQAPAPATREVIVQDDPAGFIRGVPTLLLAGVVTGMAFAIGNKLVGKYIWT